jgi:hypothetical protein
MEENKIAESIIIRVGGGIREVSRKPLEHNDANEPAPNEHAVEQPENSQIHNSEPEPSTPAS